MKQKQMLLILLALFSVSNLFAQEVPVMKKQVSGNEIRIDFYNACENKSKILLTSQFTEDIEFIPLETTDECLISDAIADLVVTEKDIFVFDYTVGYRFDRKGKFLNRIGSIGNGPGEFIKAMQMMVDTLNQWVYFADTNGNKLVKYNYDGKYIDHFNYRQMTSYNTFYKPNALLLLNGIYQFQAKNERFSLFYYADKEKKLISKYACDYQYDIPRMAMCWAVSYVYKKQAYIKDFWCDTVYRITDPLHLESYLIVDRGKFEHRKYDDRSLITGKEDVRDRMVLGINRMAESDRYIFFSSNKAPVLYDKKEKKTYAGGYKEDGLAVEDDLYGAVGILGAYFPQGIVGNKLHTYRHAYELIESLGSKHQITDKRYEAYQKMVKNLTEDDNPVVMIVKIKE